METEYVIVRTANLAWYGQLVSFNDTSIVLRNVSKHDPGPNGYEGLVRLAQQGLIKKVNNYNHLTIERRDVVVVYNIVETAEAV